MSQSDFVNRETFDILCGKELGRGVARVVYQCELDPSWVIKTEADRQSFQNIMEWETWERVKHTEFAKYFAPCYYISGTGAVLIQQKTFPIPTHKLPKKMVAFLTDFKRTNYGIYKNKIICHDYGLHLLMEKGMSHKTKSVTWSDN